jgi:hypothetical protein
LKIPKELIKTDHARGIYWSPLYEESIPFLKGEHDGNYMTKLFDTSVENLSNIWKNKHAKPRIKQLVKKNNVSNSSLFYEDLIFLSWESAKEKYLPQIGR